DANPQDLLALPPQLAVERKRSPQDLRVEGAGETAVAGERDDRDPFVALVLLEERQPADGCARAGRACHQLEHAIRVRPHVLDPGLGLLQLRRRDELHRARDLPRVSDRAYTALDVLSGSHGFLADERVAF